MEDDPNHAAGLGEGMLGQKNVSLLGVGLASDTVTLGFDWVG